MAIHPDSSFPLRANDQADVIRIFIELMREKDRAGRAEVATNKTLGTGYRPQRHLGLSDAAGEP